MTDSLEKSKIFFCLSLKFRLVLLSLVVVVYIVLCT